MNKSLLGFYFWTEFVKEALKINLITEIAIRDLLKKVAKKFNTTPTRVDRALRNLILTTGQQNIQSFFNVKYKITIRSMLFLSIDYLKNRNMIQNIFQYQSKNYKQ